MAKTYVSWQSNSDLPEENVTLQQQQQVNMIIWQDLLAYIV